MRRSIGNLFGHADHDRSSGDRNDAFLGAVPDGAATVAGFVDDAQIEVRDCFTPGQLHAAAALMKKYSDLPMDFADATLVLLADEIGSGEIVTFDLRGFRTFRFRRSRRFSLILGAE